MTKLSNWPIYASLACLWACGGPENATIDQFFRAAQSNDSTTVASMSAVAPPPAIESWKVVEVASRTTEPFTLPELMERFKTAEKARNAALEVRTKYAKDNEDDLEKIIPKLRDDPEYQFKGKLGEIQEEWTKMLDERKETETAYQELKRVVNQQSSLAGKSVMRQIQVGELQGDVTVSELLLNLKPKDKGELPFKVTLHKYNLTEPGSDRVEASRWVIVDIEGTTPEARAAASPPPKVGEPAKVAESAKEEKSEAAPRSEPAARSEPAYLPKELRGQAKIQILAPETKVEGNVVVTKIKVRNASKDWIVGFMVTDHWYDKEGNAVGLGSETHRDKFMPGEILEMEVRTQKGPNFFQNQFEFTHANGDVNATVVGSFPSNT